MNKKRSPIYTVNQIDEMETSGVSDSGGVALFSSFALEHDLVKDIIGKGM